MNELPSIGHNNLSGDYANAIQELYSALYVIKVDEDFYRKMNGLSSKDYTLSNIEVEPYTKRYNPKEYDYEITEEVKKIDELAIKINGLLKNKSTNYNEFSSLINEIKLELRGK